MFSKIRAALQRRRYRCDLYLMNEGRFCNEPAVACLIVYGVPKQICSWHIEPLVPPRDEFASLKFLARSLRPMPKQKMT